MAGKKKGNESGSRTGRQPVSFGDFLDSLESGSLSSLDRAQEVMSRARAEPDRFKRIRVAHQALGISLDCADAYVFLAREDTETVEQAFHLYRKAAGVAQKVLGRKPFKEWVGHFWGIPETRPYMRARLGLAGCLWEMGERGRAVEHYQDMVVLDSMDHLGIRYLLMPCLIELGRDDEAEELYGNFADEDSASRLYSRALLDFRREGDSPAAERALRNALEFNPYVPEYITGRCHLPKVIPDDSSLGDREEAVVYASENLPAWKATRGGREWMKRAVARK